MKVMAWMVAGTWALASPASPGSWELFMIVQSASQKEHDRGIKKKNAGETSGAPPLGVLACKTGMSSFGSNQLLALVLYLVMCQVTHPIHRQ
ncbi:MAG: hypothetical protein J3R72DRAFT_147405 [Linnemannia gamsii]|nr:MAG: hypothetical protein J3R72DRAFT_147405 [Linnemannia gamsii]